MHRHNRGHGVRLGLGTATLVAMAAFGLMACGSSSSSGTSGKTSSGATPVPVQAGINDPQNRTVAVLQFMPAAVTVKTGTTVRWSWEGAAEAHSVTFLPPGQQPPSPEAADPFFAPTLPTGPYDGKALVNSGLQPAGPQPAKPMDVTFSTPGSFTYHCVIHPQMVGTVVVKASGTDLDSPSSAKKRGAAEQTKYLAEGRATKGQLEKAAPKTTRNADGSTTYQVQMGLSSAHTDVLQFAPAPAAVKAGDTVEFLNDSGAPHTATFFGTTPGIVDPSDPRVGPPSGPSPQKLNTTSFFNSGLLPPNAPPGGGPPPQARSFSFVVPAAGTYASECVLHAPSGMGGTITAT